jgi:hypothetical protein
MAHSAHQQATIVRGTSAALDGTPGCCAARHSMTAAWSARSHRRTV